MRACPSCGARNEERGLFCNGCGGRLPAKGDPGPEEAGHPPLPRQGEATGVADPFSSSSIHGVAPPVAHAAQGTTTPPALSAAPMAVAACAACGYRIPEGQVVSWCPGCGSLFDIPVTGASPAASVPADPPAARPSMEKTQTRSFHAEAPPVVVPPGWVLVLLKAGERLDRFPLRKAEVILGRTEGDILFPDDPMLSPRHARLFVKGRAYWLEDAGSRNGVFLRLSAPAELRHGDHVTFGGLVFRYESSGSGPRSTSLITALDGVKVFGSGREKARGHLVRILQDGADGPAYPLTPARTILGRKVGHFLFPEDPLLSRQHAQFYERDGEMWVEDLGSSNGTMLRLRGPAALEKGTVFRLGDVTLESTCP